VSRAERVWLALVICVVALVVIAGADWARDHPDGTSWDESGYFNQALVDLEHTRGDVLVALARGFVRDDATRPPMYRVLALPATVAFGFSPLTLRLVSLGFFVMTLAIVFLTVRRHAGVGAACLSVALLSLSPVMVSSSIAFGTEYPLYFATAAMLFFLTRISDAENDRRHHWIGLGLSLAVGALAKATFALVAGPALAFTVLFSSPRSNRRSRMTQIAKAVTLSAVIALPWWTFNAGPALSYARYSSSFVRHALGSSLTEAVPRWVIQFSSSEIGPGSTLLVIGMVLALFVGLLAHRVQPRVDERQRAVLLLCAVSSIPLIATQLVGNNGNTRHLAPSLIFGCVAVGILGPTLVSRHLGLSIAAVGTLGSQLLMFLVPAYTGTVYPTKSALFDVPPWLVMARQEQWDWESLRELASSRRLPRPSISFLGSGRQLNVAAVGFPWALHGTGVRVTWLWRYEEGPIEWARVMSSAGDSDVVLTLPSYVGDPSNKEDLDNKHNAEFATRMEHDPAFVGPFRITLGRYERTEATVFFRRVALLTPDSRDSPRETLPIAGGPVRPAGDAMRSPIRSAASSHPQPTEPAANDAAQVRTGVDAALVESDGD
jgi:4-amino-4-deoxy-L-arabinose transferase-like glycosyltransferase